MQIANVRLNEAQIKYLLDYVKRVQLICMEISPDAYNTLEEKIELERKGREKKEMCSHIQDRLEDGLYEIGRR